MALWVRKKAKFRRLAMQPPPPPLTSLENALVAVCVLMSVVVVVFVLSMVATAPLIPTSTPPLAWDFEADDIPWPAPAPGSTRESHFPKILWTYWITDDDPALNRACRASWKWFNPEFEIRDVRRSTLKHYLPELAKLLPTLTWIDCPAKESDIVRVHLIEQYGGVWIDTTTLCYGPLPFKAHLHNPDYTFVGFKSTWLAGLLNIENWCFAATPNHVFVSRWREMLMRATDMGTIDAYLDHIRWKLKFRSPIHETPYCLMHLCGLYVYKRRLTPEQRASMLVLEAFDSCNGPLTWGWSLPQAYKVHTIAAAKSKTSDDPGMLKLTSAIRKHLLPNLDGLLKKALPADLIAAAASTPSLTSKPQ